MKARKIISAILALALIICLLPQTIVTAADYVTGSFNVASVSVDAIPGSTTANTSLIGTIISDKDWDVVGVSEDFISNDDLTGALTGYSFGSVLAKDGVSAGNADGLNLLWKNQVTVTGEQAVTWNNTSDFSGNKVSKGYRYYVAEIAPNVLVDVYVVNLDVDATSSFDVSTMLTRSAQVSQLVSEIKANTTDKPVIILGNLDALYTCNSLKSMLIDPINNDSRLTITDVWVDLVRGGSYPEYRFIGSTNLTPVDRGGTYEYPAAEVKDKIFYINNTDSAVSLTCDEYVVVNDFFGDDSTATMEGWPVVAKMTYSYEHVHAFEVVETVDATCFEDGYQTVQCACGEMDEITLDALGHDFGEPVVDSYCNDWGTSVVTCNRCGETKTTHIRATGHDYQVVSHVEMGCMVEGRTVYTCANCGHTYTETVPMRRHKFVLVESNPGDCTTRATEKYECAYCDYVLNFEYEYTHSYTCVARTNPSCVTDGVATYKCDNCPDTFTTTYERAYGHNYENGFCLNCNGRDESYVPPVVAPSYSMGTPAESIVSGNKYAIIFPSTKLYVLGSNENGDITNQVIPNVNVGDISESIVWTIEETTGGYTISADVNGETMYLARSSSINYGGYSLRLQENPFVWSITLRSSHPFARISCNLGSSSFVLRYYSSAKNWIASNKMTDICIYNVSVDNVNE